MVRLIKCNSTMLFEFGVRSVISSLLYLIKMRLFLSQHLASDILIPCLFSKTKKLFQTILLPVFNCFNIAMARELWEQYLHRTSLPEKCPYLEFSWSTSFRIQTEYRPEKFRIRTPFTKIVLKRYHLEYHTQYLP